MLRLADYMLLLPPLALGLVWWRTRAMPSPRLLAATFGTMLVIFAAIVWFGEARALPPGTYVPAHSQGGRILPEHVIPAHVTPEHVVPGHDVPP